MPQMDARIKSRTEQTVAAAHHRDVPELVRELYYDEGLSQDAVARRLGIHRATLTRWMKDWRMPTRDRRAVTDADQEVA